MIGGFIMREFWNTIQLIFTAVGGWLGWFLGGSDGLLFALIAFVVIDYITGVMCAISDKKLSSSIGFKGICRKVLIFALVGGGHILDTRVYWRRALFCYCSDILLSVERGEFHCLRTPLTLVCPFLRS